MRNGGLRAALAGAALVMSAVALAAPAKAPPVPPEVAAFQNSLHPQTGDVHIAGANATLKLGGDYYFLPAADARRVLVDAWRNPPESATGVLGMVFPKGKTFADDGWAAVISFEDTGYVSDKDAASEDYAEVMTAMKEGAEATNAERKEAGFPAVHLVGWAQPPAYDAAAHSLIWARELNFEGQQIHSLNYDVRLLGRRGVLSLNMVATMPDIGAVRGAANLLASTASFDSGARYADFNSATDKEAGYGLAGLVAAGAGVAAAKKLGLLAILLGFGKKFIILILVAGAAIGRWAMGLIGRGKNDFDDVAPATEAADEPEEPHQPA